AVTTAPRKAPNNPSLKTMADGRRSGGEAAMDQVPSTDDAGADRAGEGRKEGAPRADSLAEGDFRKLADPAQIEQAHEAAARLARAMRTRLTRRYLARRRGYRLAPRPSHYHTIPHCGGAARS